MIGLTEQGLLNDHRRGGYGFGEPPAECEGSRKTPPKVTPYASRKSLFTTRARKAVCPGCLKKVPVGQSYGTTVYAGHWMAGGMRRCPYGMRAVQNDR